MVLAQSWCPPGATWTYTYTNGWTVNGVARFTYVADTVIAGTPAQKITWHVDGTQMGSPISVDNPPIFTSVNGDLVNILTDAGFDTLYYFGAVPGDGWGIATVDGSPSFGEVVVTDTGTVVIDGVSLRRLITGSDTITERVGASFAFMLPWNQYILDEAGGPLRCYTDDQVSYQAAWWGFACDSWLGMNDPKKAIGPQPMVHSTGSQVQVYTSQAATLLICDATGRVVLHTTVPPGESTFNASLWGFGVYQAVFSMPQAATMVRFVRIGN